MLGNQTKLEKHFKALFQHANKLQNDIEEKEREKQKLEEKHEKERSIMEAKNAEVQWQKEKIEASLNSAYQYDENKSQQIKRLEEQLNGNARKESLKETYHEIVTNTILPKFKDFLIKILTVDSAETEPVAHDEWDTKEMYKIYGLLLNACKVKKLEDTDVENEAPGEEIEIKLSMLDKSKLEVQTRNMEAALSLTFQMLKILPPLVVCQPWKYHEALQDTNRVAWDEEKEQEAELIYYRPVLVYGNRLHVAVKGLVGNKKNSGEKFDKGSQTTLQDSQHGDSDISGQEEGALNNTCHTNGLPEEAKGVPDKETPTLEANDLPEEAETPTVEAKGVSDKETPMVEANDLLEEETLTLEANEEETLAVEANDLPTSTLEAKGVPDKETHTLEANGLPTPTLKTNGLPEEAKGVPDKETPTLEANGLPTPTLETNGLPEEAKGVPDKETPTLEVNGLPTLTLETNGLPEEAKGVPDKETPTLEANDLLEEAETPTVEAKGVSDKETPMVEANGLLEEETLTLEANEEETPAVEANGLPTPTLEAKGVPDKETPTLEANGLTALTQEDNPSTEENASTQEVNVSDEKKMPEIFNEMEKECSTQKKASSSTQEEGISGNSSTQVAASNEKTSKTELMSNTSAQKKSIQHNSIQDDSIQKVTGTQKIVSDYPTQNDGSTEV